MIAKDIRYEVDGIALTGYLADDETRGALRPGILVCHQGSGLTGHAKERARMLAGLGYVAFALDMYGEIATSIDQAQALLRSLLADPPLLHKRALAGLDMLKHTANVDTQRIAAIGYCFGGGLVLELARMGTGLASVVAFHPGLTNLPERDDRPIGGKVMVCAGADDPLIPAAAREKFIELMNACGADWQLLVYSHAAHSFTDKSIDALGLRGFAYHEPTDRRSWSAMRELLSETLGPV
ncbi:MAG TPA: dienelactone hydrolase family protein [Rhizomicrobium sp.]|jgi:dienelactone hydrolase